jgi:uncharacterized membrane protein
MRTTVPLAALGVQRGKLAAAASVVGAGHEFLYDVSPRAQSRTKPALLAFRVVSGAMAGGLVARRKGGSLPVGAAVGAVAAVASTFVFHRLRAQAAKRFSPRVAAVAEDLLSIAISHAAVRK